MHIELGSFELIGINNASGILNLRAASLTIKALPFW